MDKKKIIALAAGTLVAGVLSSQGLQAMTDYCNFGSGSDIRTQMLENEDAAPVAVDEALAGCKGGKCSRPARPQEGKKKQGRYNWRSTCSKNKKGKSGEGSCGEDGCGKDKKSKGKSGKDKSGEGGCGEGGCGDGTGGK